jgi:DDE_Tnp_1-associated/Transposase DDE domain
MTTPDGTLYAALSQVPDHRKARGRSYSLPSLLTFAATAMLCGAKSLYAIAQWGRDYNHLAPVLGFTRRRKKDPARYRTPCHSELHTVFAGLDVTRFEAALTAWVRAAGFDDLDEKVLHLDGKRLRGAQGHQLPGVHLLAAYSGELKAVVAQLAVADTNEHKTAPELLRVVPLGGVILTADAAFAQRDVCRAVLGGGGHYLLPVKDNQPALEEAIAAGFDRAFSPRGAGRAAGRGPARPDQREGARAVRGAQDPDDRPAE